ncbi:MAG: lectin like domain-containing protein [Clostridia bacterium]
MKNRIVSIFTAFVLLITLIQTLALSHATLAADEFTQRNTRIPNRVTTVHSESLNPFQKLQAYPFPTSYRLTDEGRVTPVKDQGSFGTCWTFGAFSSAESVAIKNNLLPNPDFSEWQMAYYAYTNQNGLARFDITNTGTSIFNLGGNDGMTMALMTRETSPILEAEAPYNGPSPSPAIKPAYALKNVFEGHNMTEWKTLIMEKGALSIGYYVSSNYYNATTKAYYCTTATGANHGVSVVGWDDNYAKSNFLTAPSAPGAWIVKNSWGTGWGDNGYFYMSYEDKSLEPVAYNYELQNRPSDESVYSYDPLGLVGMTGFSKTSAWMKNRFTSSRNEQLTEVGFYTLGDNTSYTVTINKLVGSTWTAVLVAQPGTVVNAGYSRVKLNTNVSLTAGTQFEVVVYVNTPAITNPIPLEFIAAGYSSQASSSSGQSYISSNGTTWSDIYGTQRANVCVQAYSVLSTNSPSPTPIPTPTPTASPTPSPTPTPNASLPTIHVGDYFTLGTYYGKTILWRCVDIDQNGPLLLSDRIIAIKPFDGIGTHTYFDGTTQMDYNTNRATWGSNLWETSNLRAWLNSNATGGNVFWPDFCPPTASKVWSNHNAYATEKGFMSDSNVTFSEQAAIKSVTQKSVLNTIDAPKLNLTGTAELAYSAGISTVVQNYDTAYFHNVTDKMFLLDLKQLYKVYDNRTTLGATYYMGIPTSEAVNNSTYKNVALTSTATWHYWTRTPSGIYTSPNGGITVNAAGSIGRDNANFYGIIGVRPAFYLDLQNLTLNTGTGDVTSPYKADSNLSSTPTPTPTPTPGLLSAILLTSSTAANEIDTGDLIYDAYMNEHGRTTVTLRSTYLATEIIATAVVDLHTKTAIMPAIPHGSFVLSIYRTGYLPRDINVTLAGQDLFLGDKPLKAGDVSQNDGMIDGADSESMFSVIGYSYENPEYDSLYDLAFDGIIDGSDIEYLLENLGFSISEYNENIDYYN